MSDKWGSHLRGTFSGRLARGLRARRQGDEGASLVEYALLLALIAVVAIGALTFLGKTVSGTLNNVGNTIALGGSGGGSGPVFTDSTGTPLASTTVPNFNAGIPGQSNQFYASGTPPTTFTLTNSNLPGTMTLSSGGLLSGTPSTPGGPYTFTVTATDSSGSVSTQFSLTVVAASAPVFSAPSPFSATYVAGTPQTVNFAASPATAITESGALPSGVTFTGGTTSATLSGSAASGQGGVYPITITAANGTTTNPQSFTLTVNEKNGAVTPSSGDMTDETASTITLSATGYPAPAITLTSGINSLPNGVSFTTGNGTATLTIGNGSASRNDCYHSQGFGLASPTDYPLTFQSASNGVSGATNQSTDFTLTMNCNGNGH